MKKIMLPLIATLLLSAGFAKAAERLDPITNPIASEAPGGLSCVLGDDNPGSPSCVLNDGNPGSPSCVILNDGNPGSPSCVIL